MGIFSRKKALGATAALTLALGLFSVPAQAAPKPLDVTGYSASDIVVSTPSCKYVMVTAKVKKVKNLDWTWFDTSLTRKGDEVSTVEFEVDSLKQRAQVCPQHDGLGVYTLGPAYVDATTYGPLIDGYREKSSSTYWDTTKKSFHVRGKTKSSLSAKRSGKKVTLTASAKVYSPEHGKYINYSPKNAKIQVKSGKTWKTVKTVKLSKGKATVKLSSSKKKTYRVTVPKATWAVATTSSSTTK